MEFVVYTGKLLFGKLEASLWHSRITVSDAETLQCHPYLRRIFFPQFYVHTNPLYTRHQDGSVLSADLQNPQREC